MADNSPSLIPFLGAMTAAQRDNRSGPPDEGPMAPYPNIQDMETRDPYPPQSYHTRSVSRSIHIDFSGWTQKPVHVTEGGPSGAVIYTLHLTSRNPQIKFVTAKGSPATFATVGFQDPSSELDIQVYNHRITMDVKTRLKKEGTYRSPSLENAPLTWKSRSTKLVDFELRDGNGIPLAQFNPHPSWSLRRAGRLDLFGPSVSDGRLMEEIMVTAFALVHSTTIQLEAAVGT
ncbi:hypothetical protein BJX99DRAFT_220350 [Aspergillus californicus]